LSGAARTLHKHRRVKRQPAESVADLTIQRTLAQVLNEISERSATLVDEVARPGRAASARSRDSRLGDRLHQRLVARIQVLGNLDLVPCASLTSERQRLHAGHAGKT